MLEAGLHNGVWDLYNSGLEGKWSFRHVRYQFPQVRDRQTVCWDIREQSAAGEEGGHRVLFIQGLHVCCVWDGLSSALWLDTPSSGLAPSRSHACAGGGGACAGTHTHDWPRITQFYSFISAGSRSRSRVINTATSPGNENEHRPPTEPGPAPASWSLWEGCCSKLLKCPPAGARSPWSNGWRGGPRARQPARRRRWGPWTTCPDRRSPASPGTCSPNGGCHGCTSYR